MLDEGTQVRIIPQILASGSCNHTGFFIGRNDYRELESFPYP